MLALKEVRANDCKLTVALTFDFDAESYWLGTAKMDFPAAVSRGTYGATEGVPRILTLLEQYELPATFSSCLAIPRTAIQTRYMPSQMQATR